MSLAQPGLPSAERLLTAPLHDLFDELDVELVESDIDDEGFFGAAFVLREGGIVLSMPADRSMTERNVIARGLLGNALRIPVPPLPDSLDFSELAKESPRW